MSMKFGLILALTISLSACSDKGDKKGGKKFTTPDSQPADSQSTETQSSSGAILRGTAALEKISKLYRQIDLVCAATIESLNPINLSQLQTSKFALSKNYKALFLNPEPFQVKNGPTSQTSVQTITLWPQSNIQMVSEPSISLGNSTVSFQVKVDDLQVYQDYYDMVPSGVENTFNFVPAGDVAMAKIYYKVTTTAVSPFGKQTSTVQSKTNVLPSYRGETLEAYLLEYSNNDEPFVAVEKVMVRCNLNVVKN